jgi:hypothetical protein
MSAPKRQIIFPRFYKNPEVYIWIAGLLFLAFSNPFDHSYTICPVKLISGYSCPGCGLGHAISFALRGDWEHSFAEHWFGIPALGIILFRIFRLLRQN